MAENRARSDSKSMGYFPFLNTFIHYNEGIQNHETREINYWKNCRCFPLGLEDMENSEDKEKS